MSILSRHFLPPGLRLRGPSLMSEPAQASAAPAVAVDVPELGTLRSGLLWESSYAAAPGDAGVAREPVHAGGFVAGTRVLTGSGEGRVEALRVGDTVVTRAGMRRQVKWVGRRSYGAATMAANPHLRPVLFRPGSLGVDKAGVAVPRTELRLAPMHMVAVDDAAHGGVLVPAAALVNGVTILREALQPAGAGTAAALFYVHVELNSHDMVLAEGVAAETFVDAGNRVMFHNAAEFAALYPRQAPADGRPCLHRLLDGFALERLRTEFGARASAAVGGPVRFALERWRGALEGWAVDPAAPGVPVEIEVLIDGQVLARLPANRYRPDLDQAGLAGGRCGFVCPLPAKGGHIAIRRAA